MSRRLKLDIPGPDWRVAPEELDAASLARTFETEDAPLLTVDVGFGRGEFLLALAEKAPDHCFLGIEYSFKRVLKMARRLARTELRNIRLVEATAEHVLGECLPPACVETFWVNFPDPWPKARHHRRRLIQPRTMAWLTRCLAAGGRVEIATDHAEYAEWIDETARGVTQLENLNAPAPWRGDAGTRPQTAYELEWRAEGRALYFFSYRRRGGGA